MSEQAPRSQIVIAILPEGRVYISSACLGRPDSIYASLPDSHAPVEVAKLLAELRVREDGEVRK